MRIDNYDPKQLFKSIALPIELGGTSAVTPEQAAENLQIYLRSRLNTSGSIVRKERTGVISPKLYPAGLGGGGIVNLYGPTFMRVNETINLKITNFSSFVAYNIETTDLEASRIGETIYVTAKKVSEDSKIRVNGNDYPILVLDAVG